MKRNLNLKSLIVFVFTLSFILGLSIDADAQRKKRRTRRVKPKISTTAANNAIVEQGAKDVGIQVKNVSKFVFLLGGIATGIEEIDKDVRSGKASREIADKNAQFKNNVLRSVSALREGVVKLEVDFRTKAPLKKYLVHIEGLIQQTNRAEDLARAGQFNESGKQWLVVVETLTDTLVAMP